MSDQATAPWRVYLVGEAPDLGRLQRELRSGPVVVATDDSGPYLQAEAFARVQSAGAVLAEVPPILALLNGMATLSFGGHRPVGFGGAIARNNERHIFVSDQVRLTDDLSVTRVTVDITADGVVTDADGRVLDVAGVSSMQERLASVRSHPELAEVYRVLGLGSPTWSDLYKAYELLGRAAKGSQRLEKLTGVSRDRIRLLTANSNDPETSGDAARHAVPSGPRASRQITVGEGLAIVDELIRGYLRRAGGPVT